MPPHRQTMKTIKQPHRQSNENQCHAPRGIGVTPPALDWLYNSRLAKQFSTSYTILDWLDNSRSVDKPPEVAGNKKIRREAASVIIPIPCILNHKRKHGGLDEKGSQGKLIQVKID